MVQEACRRSHDVESIPRIRRAWQCAWPGSGLSGRWGVWSDRSPICRCHPHAAVRILLGRADFVGLFNTLSDATHAALAAAKKQAQRRSIDVCSSTPSLSPNRRPVESPAEQAWQSRAPAVRRRLPRPSRQARTTVSRCRWMPSPALTAPGNSAVRSVPIPWLLTVAGRLTLAAAHRSRRSPRCLRWAPWNPTSIGRIPVESTDR